MAKFKRRGFTLIELVAVLSIISILAIMVIPKVDGILRRTNETKIISDIQTLVQAVELYNIEAKTEDLIDSDTTLIKIKEKLTVDGNEYLNTWPRIKILDAENKYVEAAENTKYLVIVNLLKSKVNDDTKTPED